MFDIIMPKKIDEYLMLDLIFLKNGYSITITIYENLFFSLLFHVIIISLE